MPAVGQKCHLDPFDPGSPGRQGVLTGTDEAPDFFPKKKKRRCLTVHTNRLKITNGRRGAFGRLLSWKIRGRAADSEEPAWLSDFSDE